MSANEFTVFTKTLMEKLPVTFRINQTELGHENVIQMFKDKHFIDKFFLEGEEKIEKER